MRSDLSTGLCYRGLLAPGTPGKLDLSVVAPAFNEAGNLVQLVSEVQAALDVITWQGAALRWELILVDDGSTDGTKAEIQQEAGESVAVKGVYLGGRHGQTAALAAGFAAAQGRLIATIDADLQNDPADLPGLLEGLGSHDAALGYRVGRRDSALRRFSSGVAKAARRLALGDRTIDTGCSLKLFRAEALRSLPLLDGMHRFFPVLLRIHGYSVVELPVTHHGRHMGLSKYGVRNRFLRGARDLIAVRWIARRTLRIRLAPQDGDEG